MTNSSAARLRPQCLGFSRFAKANLIADGDPLAALAYGEGKHHQWADTPGVLMALKSAVDALATDNTGTLAAVRPLADAFMELVRPRSLIDRILGMRQVPANTSMLKVTGGPSASWVGQGRPKPASAMAFGRETMELTKIVCGPIVVTQELVRAAGATADMAFAHELARGVAQFGDRAFIDSSYGPVTGVSPGSITFGIVPIASSGNTLAAVRADMKALFAGFVENDGQLDTAVLVMHPRTALALALLTDSGSPVFPNIGPRGGSIVGVPAFTTSACEAAGSPGETSMVLFDPGQVLLVDDGDLSVRSARHATVEMDDAPEGGATSLVSLWQHGLQALLVERAINWRRTADTGVAALNGITY